MGLPWPNIGRTKPISFEAQRSGDAKTKAEQVLTPTTLNQALVSIPINQLYKTGVPTATCGAKLDHGDDLDRVEDTKLARIGDTWHVSEYPVE